MNKNILKQAAEMLIRNHLNLKSYGIEEPLQTEGG